MNASLRTAAPVIALAMLLGGCTTTVKQKTPGSTTIPTAPISNTDACATRLQDIAGGLLLYYQVNHRLPQSLAQIQDFPGEEDVDRFVCPVSKKPYVYVPNGIFLPEKNARIVAYDPEPSHSNMRWAIQIDEPDPDQSLVAKVIALPETFFLLRR